MSKLKLLKNGIFGYHFKGYYVVRHEEENEGAKKTFDVIDENKNVIFSKLRNTVDCEWEINKKVCSPIELERLKEYFESDLYLISQKRQSYHNRIDRLTESERKDYNMISDVMYRRSKNLPF